MSRIFPVMRAGMSRIFGATYPHGSNQSGRFILKISAIYSGLPQLMRFELFRKTVFAFLAFFVTAVQGQVQTDGTLGPSVNYGTGDATIPASVGTIAGRNLFHSFSTFNVNRGFVVEFTDAGAGVSLQNVISRVTGDSATRIDGVLRSTIDGADFFFVNPQGVTFGADGSVDVPASFFISTAESIEFINGQEFRVGDRRPTLSIVDPKEIGFLRPGRQTVVVMGDVSAGPSSNFTIVANDVEIAGGSVGLETRGGNVEIVADGDVNIQNSGVALQAAEGGSLTIDAQGAVAIEQGARLSVDSMAATTGDIRITGRDVGIEAGASVSARQDSGVVHVE